MNGDKVNIEDLLIVKKCREEQKHIEANKWYMSEKCGRDVGSNEAFIDWLFNKKKYLKKD